MLMQLQKKTCGSVLRNLDEPGNGQFATSLFRCRSRMLVPVMGKLGSRFSAVVAVLVGAASIVTAGDRRGPTGAETHISPERRPPVRIFLFAIADDMGHASAYGTRWVKTPNFDRLASRGILFLNAYTPMPNARPPARVS